MLELNKEFANRLKIARARAGISQQELADSLGVSKATVSRYERLETSRILESTIDGIARKLDIDADYLLGTTNEIRSYSPGKSLSKEENDLIDAYRSLNDNGKELVKNQVESVRKVKSLRIGAEFAPDTLVAASGSEGMDEEQLKALKRDIMKYAGDEDEQND